MVPLLIDTIESGVECAQSWASFLLLSGCAYKRVSQLSRAKLKHVLWQKVYVVSGHVAKLPAFLKLCLNNYTSFINCLLIILEAERPRRQL